MPPRSRHGRHRRDADAGAKTSEEALVLTCAWRAQARDGTTRPRDAEGGRGGAGTRARVGRREHQPRDGEDARGGAGTRARVGRPGRATARPGLDSQTKAATAADAVSRIDSAGAAATPGRWRAAAGRTPPDRTGSRR